MIGEQTLEGRRENLSQANIFNRWSCQGIWLDMFKALSGRAELFGTASMDSSHVKAHRSVAGKSDIPASARIRKRAY